MSKEYTIRVMTLEDYDEENPLGPFIVLWICCINLTIPVKRISQRM